MKQNQRRARRRLPRVWVCVALLLAQPAFGASLWDSVVEGAKNTYDKLTGKKDTGESQATPDTESAESGDAGTSPAADAPVTTEAAPAAKPDVDAAQSAVPPAAADGATAPAAVAEPSTPSASDAATTPPPAEEKGMLDKTLDVMKGAYDAVDERRRAVVERTASREAGLWGVGGLYAPLALPFPSSYGFDVYYVASPKWTWEFEYRKSSYDIGISSFNFGSIDEQYFTLQARHFVHSSSLNVIYGLSYRKIEVLLARDTLELFTEDYSLAYSEAHSYVAKIGVGSHYRLNPRWTFDVDWVALNIVIDGEVDRSAQRFTSSEQGKKNARRAERFMKWYPSMTAFQVRLGVVF
jgi:hypothetical protein